MKKKADYSELAFLGAILAYEVYYAFTLRGVNYKASLWPFILMGLTSIIMIFVAADVIRTAKNAKAEGTSGEQEAMPSQTGLKAFIKKNQKVIVIFVALLLYAILIDYLGYIICNFIFALGISYYLGRNIKKAVLVAIVVTVAFWLGFDVALGVRFPKLYWPF